MLILLPFPSYLNLDPPADFGFGVLGQLEFIVLSFPIRGGAQVVEGGLGDMPPGVAVGVAANGCSPQISFATRHAFSESRCHDIPRLIRFRLKCGTRQRCRYEGDKFRSSDRFIIQ